MLPNHKASEIATGKWRGILRHFGIDDSYLTGKHGPCPLCGGKDRFRFDDKDGRGTWICNQCGSSDGFGLLERIKGWSFREAAYQVESVVGYVASMPAKGKERSKAGVQRIWKESCTVTKGDPVWRYLNRRIGLEVIPSCIRFHPALAYVEDGKPVEYHPAMIALVISQENKGIGLHRIYLKDSGEKADVSNQKKLITVADMAGSAVRLAPPTDCLGIAEGIETALAASRLFSVPVWAAISANMMEKWTPPTGVENVIIFGDNDVSFTGQASAYALAKKLKLAGLNVDVQIPDSIGADWGDSL